MMPYSFFHPKRLEVVPRFNLVVDETGVLTHILLPPRISDPIGRSECLVRPSTQNCNSTLKFDAMEIRDDLIDGILILRFNGRLDAASSGSVQESILQRIEQGHSKLAFDFNGLTYISSAGLRVVLLAHKRLHGNNGHFILFGLQDSIREIFDIAGFSSMLSITNSEEAARQALQ